MAYQKHDDYTEVFDVQNIYNVEKHLVKIAAETKDYVGGIKADTDYMVDKWLYDSCTKMASQLTLIAGYENVENEQLESMASLLNEALDKIDATNEQIGKVATNLVNLITPVANLYAYMSSTSSGGMAYAMSNIVSSFQGVSTQLGNVANYLASIAGTLSNS